VNINVRGVEVADDITNVCRDAAMVGGAALLIIPYYGDPGSTPLRVICKLNSVDPQRLKAAWSGDSTLEILSSDENPVSKFVFSNVHQLVRRYAVNGMRRKIVGKRPEEIRAMSKEEVAAPITMVGGCTT
jgi:hypothetical protein